MEVEQIVSDEQLKEAFEDTDFGDSLPRNIIKYALLKFATGMQSGSTVNYILLNLKLIYRKKHQLSLKLTSTGRLYLWAAFSESYNNE